MFWVVLFIIAIIIFTRKIAGYKVKGWFGEKLLAALLYFSIDHNKCAVLHNIMLPTADGATTQIDHIVVSPYGIFVIETKSYKGWIFGNANQSKWTQVLYKKKSQFQNPLHQNYKHIMTLSECLGVPTSYFKTVIAFSGEAKFKTDLPPEVVHIGDVANYIKKNSNNIIIKPSQVFEIAQVIKEWQGTITFWQRIFHVRNLRKNYGRYQAPHEVPERNKKVVICPACGSEMILRTNKKDGSQFYGCSSFPKCRKLINV